VPLFSQVESKYRNTSDFYFPKYSFSERDNLDAFIQTWYGKHLDVLDNENLIIVNNKNVVRFTCLRTFHKPFSIKIIWDNNNANLIFNMSNGMGGYESGILMNQFQKTLKIDQINKLIEIININNIFNESTTIDDDGFDGSQWIIEINISGKYKVIDRWTPKKGVAYNIGIYLIELSGEKIENLY
jgi:hypothetical protein